MPLFLRTELPFRIRCSMFDVQRFGTPRSSRFNALTLHRPSLPRPFQYLSELTFFRLNLNSAGRFPRHRRWCRFNFSLRPCHLRWRGQKRWDRRCHRLHRLTIRRLGILIRIIPSRSIVQPRPISLITPHPMFAARFHGRNNFEKIPVANEILHRIRRH